MAYAIVRRMLARLRVTRWFHLCAVEFWRLDVERVPVPRRLPRNFTVRRATNEDVDALAHYYDDPRRVETRRERGDICVVALCQNAICAAVWIAVGPCRFDEDQQELGCTFVVPPRIGWTYDGKGTRLGAWGTLMKQLPAVLHEQGVTELVTVIDCNNWQSIDGHRALGYEVVGTLGCVRGFGLFCRIVRYRQRVWTRLPRTVAKIQVVTPSGGTTVDT